MFDTKSYKFLITKHHAYEVSRDYVKEIIIT